MGIAEKKYVFPRQFLDTEKGGRIYTTPTYKRGEDKDHKEGWGLEQITLLHCNTEYPTPSGAVNLRAMKTLSDCFGVKTGYSDHTKGIEVSLAAVALGAVVIGNHFTLDRILPGPTF